MAKAKLGTLTEKWIDGKPEKQQSANKEKRKAADNNKKIKQTLHISERANKLLWYNRVETGETISAAVNRLVLENLEKNHK